MAFVYCVVNTSNGKCYVGKTVATVQKRWWRHVKSANAGSKCHFHNAIRKYGRKTFEIHTLEECSDSDVDSLEIMWIYLLATNKNGYNSTLGGDGSVGFRHSDETKRKISESAKLRKTYSMQGRKHTPETIEKMRRSQLGKKLSEETRLKMSQSHQARISNNHNNP